VSHAHRQDLDWLVSDFASRVADVAHAAVVSADGVPLAVSEMIPSGFTEQLAAITSGLASLMQGAARIFEAGPPTQALIEMESGLMLLKSISDGSSLLVLASPDCDTDLVSYEMSLLVEAAGEVLSPALRGAAQPGFLGTGSGWRGGIVLARR
jgi:predicted regulator of Ras-like GTPase activity (Roadblock/LC7/MglB family)